MWRSMPGYLFDRRVTVGQSRQEYSLIASLGDVPLHQYLYLLVIVFVDALRVIPFSSSGFT